MTTTTRSHQQTGLSTPLHLAEPTPRVHVPPAYGMRFGLAAVVLSLFGVPSSPPSEFIDERSVASRPVASAEVTHPAVAQESHANEWDNWKAMRDLA